jgi:hypothetical protein
VYNTVKTVLERNIPEQIAIPEGRLRRMTMRFLSLPAERKEFELLCGAATQNGAESLAEEVLFCHVTRKRLATGCSRSVGCVFLH